MAGFVGLLLIIGGLGLFGWAGCAMWGMNFIWFMIGSIIVHLGAKLMEE